MKFHDVLGSKCYDLGQAMERDIPIWPSHPPFFMTISLRHGDIEDPSGCGYGGANEVIMTSGHHSTHIDALSHISTHGKLYGDVNVADIQKGAGPKRGMTVHGVENIPPIVKRGILLDIPRLKGKDHLSAAEVISSNDLQQAAERQNVAIKEGDCVLVRTGWTKFWHDRDAYIGMETGLPGPDLEAAKWLADQKIFLTGSDTLPYEVRKPQVPGLPVHQELINKNGIYIVECLNLEELAADQVYEFLYVAIPLKITGATGSPIRPIALV